MPTIPSAFATAPINPCYSGPSQERYFAPFRDHAWTNLYDGPRHRWSSFNPTSPCYTGTKYPSYSATEQFEFPNGRAGKPCGGLTALMKIRRSCKFGGNGYLNVSGLQKDNHGIWRCNATMKNGRSVAVILPLANGGEFTQTHSSSLIAGGCDSAPACHPAQPRSRRHELKTVQFCAASDQVTFVDEAASTASRKNGANSGELILPSGENRATNLPTSQSSTSWSSLSFWAAAIATASSG